MTKNDFKLLGNPTWSETMVPGGLDISVKVRDLTVNPSLGAMYEYMRSLQGEPALFLRLDLRDFSDPSGARFMKGFLESLYKPNWPKVQKRIAVLVCSVEERRHHSGILDNLFGSGVKWQERKDGEATP